MTLVSDIDLQKLFHAHKRSGCIGTISAYRPDGRFGVLEFQDAKVSKFREKVKGDEGWINCGFMVMEPTVFDYIQGDDTIFEQEPLSKLAETGQLNSYKHDGFWQCMDTMRDRQKLELLWKQGTAPWKVWKD